MKIQSVQQVLDVCSALEHDNKLTSIAKNSIVFAFDVRKSGATVAHTHVENLLAAAEAGQRLRAPFAVRNGNGFSILDGRHFKTLHDRLEGDTIEVYLLPFDLEGVSAYEQGCLETAGLILNMAKKGTTPRLMAGLPDVSEQIVKLLRSGQKWPKTALRAAFEKTLTDSQFEYVYRKAYGKVYNAKAQAIREVRRANPTASPAELISAVGGNPTDAGLLRVATESSLRSKTGNKKRVRGHHWAKRVSLFQRGLGEHSSIITVMRNEDREGRKGLTAAQFHKELGKLELQKRQIDAAYRDVLERGYALEPKVMAARAKK